MVGGKQREPEATHIATIVKMTRVMLLVPVLLVVACG